MDMFNNGEVIIGNGSLQPDSGVPDFTAVQNYFILNITAGSAQEHDMIQTMFPDQNAVSTVRLLQLAQQRATNGNSPILELDANNYAAAGNQTYRRLWHEPAEKPGCRHVGFRRPNLHPSRAALMRAC